MDTVEIGYSLDNLYDVSAHYYYSYIYIYICMHKYVCVCVEIKSYDHMPNQASRLIIFIITDLASLKTLEFTKKLLFNWDNAFELLNFVKEFSKISKSIRYIQKPYLTLL